MTTSGDAVLLANDPEVAPRTATMPYPFTLADAETWWKSRGRTASRETDIVFALERKEDGAFLGALGLEMQAPGKAGEIGFWLGRPYWNQGYMTEAIWRLLAYAFEDEGLRAVRAAAFPDNVASIRVQEKLGMSLVGRERRPAPARGGDQEVIVREIRRERWRR